MRRWTTGLALAAALLAAACGQNGQKAEKAGIGPMGGELRIYNWSDYIDPALLEQFTKETGTKVIYDTFDSNEVLETKVLQGNTGYDLVVPSNNNLARYIAAGAIEPLDKTKLPGLENLSLEVMGYLAPFDPGARYAVPYMQGTIGIGYNEDAIHKYLPGVDIDSWKVVFDPANMAKLKDCGVYFLDASEDMYSIALTYLGKDPNSKNLADYTQATEMLMKVRPYVRKFHSSELIDALAAGDICLAIGYSGDVLQARDGAEDADSGAKIAYVIPKEGSQAWADVFVIPKGAPHPAAAHAFIAFMLRPDIIARASNYTAYANANLKATSLVDEEVRSDPNIYPTPEVAKRLFVITAKDQALLREVNRQWTRVLTGK